MSSKGFVVLAQNNTTDDYVRMAYALALSLRVSQHDPVSISLITDTEVTDQIRSVFDTIEVIADDDAKNSTWKIENRYKIYDLSPYNETIVLDTDMLVLADISNYWEILKKYQIYFTSKVVTYRGDVIDQDNYRRVFTANKLPNLYTGLHYFKKSKEAEEFYSWMKLITKHWSEFYNKCLTKSIPSFPSMDVTAALTAKILDCETQVTDNQISFVHMKPAIQGWKIAPDEWQHTVGSYFDSYGKLKIGNFLQDNVFHYTEKKFLTDEIIDRLEQLWKC